MAGPLPFGGMWVGWGIIVACSLSYYYYYYFVYAKHSKSKLAIGQPKVGHQVGVVKFYELTGRTCHVNCLFDSACLDLYNVRHQPNLISLVCCHQITGDRKISSDEFVTLTIL